MPSFIFVFLTVLMVSAQDYGVDSAFAHVPCASDNQCPIGFFCYKESSYCTQCLECAAYKRKSSWRTCPKIPAHCDNCMTGYEEEILHDGKTRDMCVLQPVANDPLGHAVAGGYPYERYLWGAAATALLLPILFYAFCRNRRERGAIHHGLPHEEPPPYRSIELTTLTSNSSEERISEEDHVLCVGQQKDCLVQAVPFRQPDYVEAELLAFDTTPPANHGEVEVSSEVLPAASSIDLHDDNTMPSDWTPDDSLSASQLMNFESTESEQSSGSEDTCEPATKRRKGSSAQSQEETCNTNTSVINLIINNNLTIHKPS